MLKTANNALLKHSLNAGLIFYGVVLVLLLHFALPVRAMPEFMKDRISQVFDAADKNKDGKLTPGEAKEGGMPDVVLGKFDLIDTDKSGTMSLSEIIAAFDKGVIKR
jgi:hypothetical protein